MNTTDKIAFVLIIIVLLAMTSIISYTAGIKYGYIEATQSRIDYEHGKV